MTDTTFANEQPTSPNTNLQREEVLPDSSQQTTRLRKFLDWTGGIDRQALMNASAAERTAISALPLLMLANALFTGLLVAWKVSTLASLGLIVSSAVAIFVGVVVLLFEAAILGTMSGSGRKMTWLRFALAGVLTTVQVATTAIIGFSDQINFSLHESSLNAQASIKNTRQRLYNVSEVNTETTRLGELELRTRSDLATPPPDGNVQDAQEKLEVALRTKRLAEKGKTSAGAQVQRGKTLLEGARDETTRARAEIGLARAQAALDLATKGLTTADSNVTLAEGLFQTAKDEQRSELKRRVEDAEKDVRDHAEKRRALDTKLEKEESATARLAEKATAPSLATQIGAWLKLCAVDAAIRIQSILFFAVYLFIDALPLLIKLGLLNSDYARTVRARQDAAMAKVENQARMAVLDSEAEFCLRKNDADGIRLFAEQDRGASIAEKLLLQAQADADSSAADSCISAFTASLIEVETAINRLDAIEKRVQGQPKLEAAFKSHLGILLAQLRARAAKLTTELQEPGLGTSSAGAA